MSRYYQMSIVVSGFQPLFHDAIEQACLLEWNFDDFNSNVDDKNKHFLCAAGDDSLCGGEGEEEFVLRLTHAIWKANKAFCQVDVTATFLGGKEEPTPEPEVIDPNEECACGMRRSGCDYHKRT